MSDLDLDVAFNINEAEVEAATRNTRERIRSVGNEARAQGQATKQSFSELQASINQTARQSEATMQSALGSVRSQSIAAAAGVESAVSASVTSVAGSTGVMIERLKLQFAQLTAQRDLTGSGNASKLIALNQQIDNTQAQIGRMSNAGREGFDAFGNAIAKNTNLVGTAWGGIRKLAQILPGVGVAGIIAFAVGPIVEYISKLDIFKGKLDQAAANLKALNDVNKEAAKDASKQIANLQILYKAATDVNNSMADRVRYAEQIRATYPQSFANSTAQAILNGQEAKSYDTLAKSIVDQARAKAVADKEGALAATIIEAQFQKAKIESARKSQIDRVYSGEGRSNNSMASDESYIGVINYDAEKAAKAQDEIIKLASTQLKFVQNFAGGSAKVANELTKGTNLIQEPLKNFDALVNKISQKADIDNIKAALEAKMKALAPNDKQLASYRAALTKLSEIEKAYNPKTDKDKLKADQRSEKTDDSQREAALNARRAALEKIASLDREFDRKALDANDEQIQAIRDKFTVLRNEINKANIEIDRANGKIKDPNKRISRVPTNNIDGLEQVAINNQMGLQDFDYYKNDLEQQKKIFDEFEDYKLQVGSKKAKERFAADLNGSESFIEYLQKELSADRIDPNDKSEGTAKRKQLLEAELAKELAAQKVNYSKLLDGLRTYETERTAIQESAMTKIEELRKKGNNVEADVLRKQTEIELTEFDKKRVEQLDSFKGLFDNIDRMSTSALRKSLTSLQGEVSKLTLTPKAKEFFDKLFGDTKYRLDSQSATEFKNLGSALGEAAQYAGKFDEGLASALSTAADISGQIGNIKQGLADFNKAKGLNDVIGQLSAGVGMFGAGLSIISTIGGLFDNSKKNAEQQKYATDLQIAATQALNKALERQLALTKEIYGPARLAAYQKSITDIADAQEKVNEQLAGRVSNTGNKVADEKQIAFYNNLTQQQKDNSPFKAAIDHYLATGQSVSLVGKSLEELEKLLDSKKLDEKTAAIVQSMIDLDKQAKETAISFAEELTGISFDSLNDQVKSLFDNGEASVEKFADVIEQSIHGALSNAFKRNEIETALQPFYEQLSKAGKDGVFSDDEIAALRAQKDAIAKTLADRAAAYQKIIGSDDTSKDANSLQGAYKAASQESIDLLSANTGGLRIAAVEGNNLIKAGNDTLADGLVEMRKQTLSIIEIAENTKATAGNTQEMKESLKSIDKKMDDNKNYNAGTGRVG